MAVCNTFSKLSKETGTFLTFSQYMEDLTAWKTESKYYKIVPSKFIAVDCKPTNYTNITLPKMFQEYFENACACFKNTSAMPDDIDNMVTYGWSPEHAKVLFWNMMLGDSKPEEGETDDLDAYHEGLINISDIKYVGDINLQSYNTVDGMGYSEIYCHIPNEAPAYEYGVNTADYSVPHSITKNYGDIIEGFKNGDLSGWEKLSLKEVYEYNLDKSYEFSWEDVTNKSLKKKLEDKSFNINMIVVLYDIWNDNNVIFSGIPMGIYITGLIGDDGNITNPITKYVANEDIYNSGTSYGLRICSRYVVSEGTDNYVVKEVTVEDNNYSDLSRVLSQLSISQGKMDEVINKTYNTEQNYKNLLAIFKNSRTNVPYIKIVNNESCWFVNGKLIGPSVVDGVYDAYTNDEIDYLLNSKISQSFQIVATVQDQDGKNIFDLSSEPKKLTLKWDTYYEGRKVQPNYLGISRDDGETKTFTDYTNTNQLALQARKTTNYTFHAKYGQLEHMTTITVYFVYPVFFGEISCGESNRNHISTTNDHSMDNNKEGYQTEYNKVYESGDLDFDWVTEEKIKQLTKYTTNTQEGSYEITTDSQHPGHIVYAYPASYGPLKYINDYDGYLYYNAEYNNDDKQNAFVYIKKTLQEPIPGLVDESTTGIEYYVYVIKEPIYLYKQILKFKKQITINEWLNK